MRRKDHDAELLCRRIAMVEVEDNNVGLAAVDTRVTSQVFADQRPVLGAITLYPGHFLADVDLSVADVVRAPIRCMTNATPGLTSAF
jgi:hypothetical protein